MSFEIIFMIAVVALLVGIPAVCDYREKKRRHRIHSDYKNRIAAKKQPRP